LFEKNLDYFFALTFIACLFLHLCSHAFALAFFLFLFKHKREKRESRLKFSSFSFLFLKLCFPNLGRTFFLFPKNFVFCLRREVGLFYKPTPGMAN
jgi:hypothetical protein